MYSVRVSIKPPMRRLKPASSIRENAYGIWKIFSR
jgi:hypothetical protein